MHGCLKRIWNTAWSQENRVVIPKLGKDSYNECTAYRTVAITSIIGKRFELITSRVLAIMEQQISIHISSPISEIAAAHTHFYFSPNRSRRN